MVYSTGAANSCSSCGKPLHKCKCPTESVSETGDGILRLERQSKGRAGKQVTLIQGLDMTAAELKALLKILKSVCGSGGTVKDSSLEIQGDHRDKLKIYLEQQGHRVKLSGG